MTTHLLSKAALVASPAAVWFAVEHEQVGRTVVLVAALALVTWMPVRVATRRTESAAPAGVPPTVTNRDPHAHGRARRRIERKPTGRIARDVRCPSGRRAAAARRSTRR